MDKTVTGFSSSTFPSSFLSDSESEQLMQKQRENENNKVIHFFVFTAPVMPATFFIHCFFLFISRSKNIESMY